MSIFLKLTAFIAGAVGLVFLFVEPLIGIVLLCIGALLILMTSRSERAELEERRHRELVDAARGASELSLEERARQAQAAIERRRR